MSSSSHPFIAGFDFDAPRPVATASVVTAAPFAVPVPAAQPAAQFRPMVFLPFDGMGTIVSGPEQEEPADVLEDVEVVEAKPPPPDFEAMAAEARSEGYQQGYQEGYREGMRLATEEQREISARLAALLGGVASDNEGLLRSLETQVVDLALAVAEKVIAREARIDREIVVSVARSALAEIH